MGGADSEVTKGIVGEEERPVMTGRSYSTIPITEDNCIEEVASDVEEPPSKRLCSLQERLIDPHSSDDLVVVRRVPITAAAAPLALVLRTLRLLRV